MLASDGLHPSAKGKRVKLAGGKFTIIDGPFTESKELVASYALFQVKTMDEAIHWTKRFLEVLGQGECELRPIFEAAGLLRGGLHAQGACPRGRHARQDEAQRRQVASSRRGVRAEVLIHLSAG